ncbi:Ig-like domain-containing protein, partial [Bacillus toyonensis]|uniref:Ig-like domain-containing protein n=1 Tax=Bacillus toyonensis TaxID=155322 RepID=UPI003D20CC7F
MTKKISNQLKPINIMATTAIVATTLFTPVIDILPAQHNVAHAEETQNVNIVRYDKENNWKDLPLMNGNTTKIETDFVRINRGAPSNAAAMVQDYKGTTRNLRQFTTKIRINEKTSMHELYMYMFSVGNIRYNLDSKQWLLDSVKSYTNVIEYTAPINYNWNEWAEVRGEIIDNDSKFQLYFNGKKVLQIKINNKGSYNNFVFGLRKSNSQGGGDFGYDYFDMEYLNYSNVVSNEKPVITGEANTTIMEGTTFDPLSGMSATDKEDGNLTGKMKVMENTVDSQKQGTYKVKYEVTDRDGNTVAFERAVTVEEKDVTAPEAPKVNKVTDQDTKVTGTGEKGATVKVTVDGKEIGTGKVDDQGNYSVDIPKQPGGKEVVVTVTDTAGNTSQPGKTKVEEKDVTAPEAPKVNKVTDQDTKVTGTGEKGATVKVTVDGKEIGIGKVDNQGNYSVDIPKQPGGKEVVVTLIDTAGNTSESGKTKVEEKDVTAPEAPKVNKVTDQDTKVTGTGEKVATVKVVVDGKEIGTGKVDDQGNYSVDIPKQPGGKEVVVTVTDASGNTSQPGKTKVESKDITAPEAPKVNKVTDQDTKVTGTGEKGATVKVTVDGKEIGTGKVDNQGNYSVDIPKQPGGKAVVVTLTDTAGNISKPTKATVQEDPAIEDAKVKGAKLAIDDILTDLIQTNYSHDFSIVKKGAIQVHVAQHHITEAQE